jgi:hypothetical protein
MEIPNNTQMSEEEKESMARLKHALELIEEGNIQEGMEALQREKGVFDGEHSAITHYMMLNPYRKESSDTIRLLLKEGEYEEKYPSLALKAYCFLGDITKVEELLDKGADPNCQKITYQNALADCLSEDRKEIIVSLIKHNKKKPMEARSAMLKACNNNLQQALSTILNNKDKVWITQTDLRDAAYHCILRDNEQLFQLSCKHAPLTSLQVWKDHIQKMDQTAQKEHLKRRYNKELKIISKEMLNREIKKSAYDPWNIEI